MRVRIHQSNKNHTIILVGQVCLTGLILGAMPPSLPRYFHTWGKPLQKKLLGGGKNNRKKTRDIQCLRSKKFSMPPKNLFSERFTRGIRNKFLISKNFCPKLNGGFTPKIVRGQVCLILPYWGGQFPPFNPSLDSSPTQLVRFLSREIICTLKRFHRHFILVSN